MRKVLFVVVALLAICACVAAAEKLSTRARRRVAAIKVELQGRISREPLSFHELCWVEATRLDKDEEDYLESLYSLRRGLVRKIRKLNPFWRPKEEPERKYKYAHREYDITDMVTQPPDRPAPAIGFGYGPYLEGSTVRMGGGVIDMGGDEDETGTGFDWEMIEGLIERILPQDYGGERSIYYRGGKLICSITAEDARVLEALLKQLRESAGYFVNIEVKFLRTTARYLRQLRKEKGGQVIHLSPEAEEQLLEDIAAGKGVEVVASSEVIAANNQMVHIREGQQVSLLMDYDINTVGIPTLQPVVRLVNEGLICQFRPTVIRSGKALSINVMTSLSGIRKKMRKGEFLGGELLFPAMDMSRLRTDVGVPSGRAVLVGGTALTSGGDEKESREFVVYLKPTVGQKKK